MNHTVPAGKRAVADLLPRGRKIRAIEMGHATGSRSPVPVIRLEKRAGKTVTVVAGLHTYGSARLEAICRQVKALFGTGGTVKNGLIEIQGDKVAAIRQWFTQQQKT